MAAAEFLLDPLDLDANPSLFKSNSALEEQLGAGDLESLVDLSSFNGLFEDAQESCKDQMVEDQMTEEETMDSPGNEPDAEVCREMQIKPEPDEDDDGEFLDDEEELGGLQALDVKIETLNLHGDNSLDDGFNFDSLVPIMQVKAERQTDINIHRKSTFGKTKRRKLSEDAAVTVEGAMKGEELSHGKIGFDSKLRKGAVYKPGEVTITKDNKVIVRRGPRGKYVCRRCGAKKGGHVCTMKSIRSVGSQADLGITKNSRGGMLSHSEITKNKYTFLHVKNKWRPRSKVSKVLLAVSA
jgi:hypothetical protein